MSWPLVALSSIAEIFTGNTPSKSEESFFGGDIPFISPSELELGYVSTAKQTLTEKGANVSRLIPANSVMVCCIGSLGKVGITAVPVVTNQQINSLVVNQKLAYPLYVYYFCKTLKNTLNDMAPKTTVAIVNKTKFSALQIPLPPLETQKKIAAVLEKADQLRKDCLQMEQELNRLAQSVFIDMFGDPVTNPKGWEVKSLSDVAMVVTGNTPSRAKSEYYGLDIEWIKSGNINTPSDYLTTAGEYLSEAGKKVGRVVPPGSILMTCIAGSPDCIGNIAMADREVAFNQQINALVPKKNKLNTEFLFILLKVGKKVVQSASTNSMKGMISKSKLESIKLPFPSYDEQCDFSEIYVKLQKSVKEQAEQVIDAELFFNALMQKAFKGELNL